MAEAQRGGRAGCLVRRTARVAMSAPHSCPRPSPFVACVLAAVALVALPSCSPKKKVYRTTVEVTRVHAFGRDPKAPGMMDVELRYVACPGDARKVVRGDKTFASCGLSLATGQKLEADVVSTYNAERGTFRSDVVKLGTCDLKTDPKDEANYEQVEDCSELKITGAVVGVRCERKRSDALIDKCPWLRR